MNDLTTLPSSVRSYLMSAHDTVNETEGEKALRQTVAILANTNPDLCVALVAAHLGQSAIAAACAEETTEKTSNAKYMLGIKYSDDVKTITRTRRLRQTTE